MRNVLKIQFFPKKYFFAFVQVYEPTCCCSTVIYVEYIIFEIYFKMFGYYNEYLPSGQTLPTIFIFLKNEQKEQCSFIFSKGFNNVEYIESAVATILIIVTVNVLFHRK